MPLIALALAAAAPLAPAAPLSPAEIVAKAPASDWRAIAASDLLVMTLAPDAQRRPRRVVIQLIAPPFSQGWVGNIRTLAAAHWWDGTSINRVQDNYVVQWGDPTEKKPLPPGLRTVAQAEYVAPVPPAIAARWRADDERARAAFVRAATPIDRDAVRAVLETMSKTDAYAAVTGHDQGWPYASDRASVWPVHCYGMVGVGRDLPPNTGSGAELYVVIGHAPRHLDRNIALVGRVVEGIEQLSSLPRGTQALGFYKTPAERTAIVSVRLASELPAAAQPRFEYLATDSASFAAYADARANRRDAFFIRAAGGADVCNVPVPVRPVP